MKIIDLSVTIDSEIPSDPPMLMPKIEILDHVKNREEMMKFFGLTKVEDLPEGNAWGTDWITLTSHAGTHLDSPWHFYPTMNGGEPAWTIDEVPLEWCIGNGVVADFSDKPAGYLIQPEDFEGYFKRKEYTLKSGDIVLLMSGAAKKWGTKEYISSGCGVSKKATLWLIDQGVRVMGTDAWGWDVPLAIAAQRFKETGDPSIIWEGHRAGREKAYCHLEKLANLDLLPLTGFTVICLPVKIKRGSAGWTRAIALFE